MNPMMGEITPEMKEAMMRRAMLSGAAGILSASGQGKGLGESLAAGVGGALGSSDSMMDQALRAQAGSLRKKNIESQIESRQNQQKLDTERLKILQSKAEKEAGRADSANYIRALLGGDASEKDIAGAMMQHNLMYGGGIPGNVQNVLLPGGVRMSPMDQLMATMMMGQPQNNYSPIQR